MSVVDARKREAHRRGAAGDGLIEDGLAGGTVEVREHEQLALGPFVARSVHGSDLEVVQAGRQSPKRDRDAAANDIGRGPNFW